MIAEVKLVYSSPLLSRLARPSHAASALLRCLYIILTMNECLQQLRPQQAYRQEDGDGLNSHDVAGWGSHAGHGNLSRSGGIESMNVPRVPDVRFLLLCPATGIDMIAISLPQHLYRFNVIQPTGKDQACSRNDNACVQVQRWYHCRRRLESNSWILCR